jgi:outer membrane protein OmpA-like peptidoglycan-associated protein
MTAMRLAAIVAGAVLVSGCASKRNLVVVLPEGDGHVGAVVVHAGESTALLNSAYAAAAPNARSARRLRAGAMGERKVRNIFQDAMAAMPEPPISRYLFFESDSLTLTPDSAVTLQALLQTIKTRRAVEIVLTGHTDTKGAGGYNDALSLQRAESIKQSLLPILAEYGVTADSISTAGRGERDLLVNTPDETDEPRNRRVEITLR